MGTDGARGSIAAILLSMAVAGCTPHVVKVTMDPARLSAPVQDVATTKVACPYRLGGIVDARGDGDRVGGMGDKMFILADAPGVVRRQLLAGGFSDNAAPGTPQVALRILKFYLATNGVTKIPVVVYQARVDQQAPFLIRSQLATMDWVGSQDEAYGAYARAFQDANAQLIARLDQGCAGR